MTLAFSPPLVMKIPPLRVALYILVRNKLDQYDKKTKREERKNYNMFEYQQKTEKGRTVRKVMNRNVC